MTQISVTAQNEINQVTVTFSPEEAAKIYAMEAAASAAAALASEQAAEMAETNAEMAASASAVSATQSANSASQSANSATASAISANDSANSAADALAAKQAAELAETNAETAASASAASATQSANSASAASASASAASGSASAASVSASAASGSASAAAASATQSANSAAASAASATQSANSATASAASATQAANSAAAITNQIDFTGVQDGDLLLRQTGLFRRINQTSFLRSKVPFEGSPLGFFFQPKSIIAWDNFDRPDENPVTDNSSGQSYTSFRGSSLGRVFSKTFRSSSAFPTESVAAFDAPATQFIGLQWNVRRVTTNSQAGIMLIKDDNNFIFFGRPMLAGGIFGGLIPNSDNYVLYAVIAGVATLLGTITNVSVFGGGSSDGFQDNVIRWVIRYGNRGRNSASRILIYLLENPALRIEVDMTTYNTTFTAPADYRRIGIMTPVISAFTSSYCVADLTI